MYVNDHVWIQCLKIMDCLQGLMSKSAVSWAADSDVLFQDLKVHGVCSLPEFLHCRPVGSKPGCNMPNMAVPDFN